MKHIFMYIAHDLHATSQQTVYNDPLSDLRHQELPSDDMFRLWKAGWPHVAAMCGYNKSNIYYPIWINIQIWHVQFKTCTIHVSLSCLSQSCCSWCRGRIDFNWAWSLNFAVRRICCQSLLSGPCERATWRFPNRKYGRWLLFSICPHLFRCCMHFSCLVDCALIMLCLEIHSNPFRCRCFSAKWMNYSKFWHALTPMIFWFDFNHWSPLRSVIWIPLFLAELSSFSCRTQGILRACSEVPEALDTSARMRVRGSGDSGLCRNPCPQKQNQV